MTGDLLTLSTREMDTLAIITRLAERRMTQAEAAGCLDRSERQVRRLLRAFEQDGPAGLRDKRRGRPAPNRIPKAYQEYVLGLVRERYADFGPTFASEKLQEYHDIRVATETLRKWMIADGIWKTRAQQRKRIQQPRHRRDCYGELVQIDGSDHRRRDRQAHGASHVRNRVGVQLLSRDSFVSRAPRFTQFGRAMTDLNIDVICANTPAAKGRVERAHQTLQDRLVKELRLRGICTMDEANRYLPEFMQDYNRRFGRVARNDHDAHRPLTELDCLDDIFTWQEERRVTAQLTVHHKRTMYLLEPTEEAKAAARKRVTVVEYEDGGVSIRFEGVALAARPFHKDGCVTQGSIVENKLLSGALTEIRKRQHQKEKALVKSAKTKREKRIVRDRFADRLPPPGP
jgi:transposase